MTGGSSAVVVERADGESFLLTCSIGTKYYKFLICFEDYGNLLCVF